MKKTLSIALSFFILIAYVIISPFLIYILSLEGLGYYSLIITGLLSSTTLFIIFRKKIITDFKSFNFKKFKTGFKYWFIAFLLMIACNNLLITLFNTIAENEEANRSLINTIPIISFIYMCIFAPFCEEICFRLNLKKHFNNIYLYSVISGLIFGYLHVASDNLLFIIPYGILGFYFAYMYEKTNNIFTPIIFHALHNSISVILVILGGIL